MRGMRLLIILLTLRVGTPFSAGAQVMIPAAGRDESVGVALPSSTVAASPFATEITSRAMMKEDLPRLAASSGYRLLPGDTFRVTLIQYSGSAGTTEQLAVDIILEQDYTAQLPLVGSVDARGKTYEQFRREALARFRKVVAVQFADLQIAGLALFPVFATGAVAHPGYVLVHGMTRVSDAIAQAGGVLQGASYRRIALSRDGSERTLDLLRFASGEDKESNPLLTPGDAIHVPVAETGAQVSGKVRYPALYELAPGETLGDLIELAGGPVAGANLRELVVARVDATGAYVQETVDLAARPDYAIQDGDTVTIPSASENAPMILVDGALFGQPLDPVKPAAIPDRSIALQVPYTPGMTLLGLLERLGGPTPAAEAKGGYIVRAATGQKVPVDVQALWKKRDPRQDLLIEPGDHLVVPQMILNVAIQGEVVRPGIQGLVAGFTLADYVRAAGGVSEARGSLANIRVTRADGSRIRAHRDFEPSPGDTIVIGKTPIAAIGDFFRQNVFTLTAIVVGVLTVATNVVDFINLVK